MRQFQALIVILLAAITVELGLLVAKPPTPVAQAQPQIPTPPALQTDIERRLARDEHRIADLEAALGQPGASPFYCGAP